jgi:hypothetical protein
VEALKRIGVLYTIETDINERARLLTFRGLRKQRESQTRSPR